MKRRANSRRTARAASSRRGGSASRASSGRSRTTGPSRASGSSRASGPSRASGSTRASGPSRTARPKPRNGPPGSARGEYDFDYAGTTGELDQNEYGGDLYGGGRYGRGPFEQSQRYGESGFPSRTGAYGSLQRQFENRYASGGYSGLKTSGRALGGPPDAARATSKRAARGRTPAVDHESDARIHKAICDRLTQPIQQFDADELANEHLDVSDVRVSVAGGKVILEGTVPERRMKHYIEDLVDACPGVQDIENRIRVPR